VRAAAGPTEKKALMCLSNEHTLSSLSAEWIHTVGSRRRGYEHVSWNKTATVQITTLDRMIEWFGNPDFVRIDVEGYEFEVLKGLSSPVRLVSYKYSPELPELSRQCVRLTRSLGDYEFNYSAEATMRMSLPKWVNSVTMCRVLTEMDPTAPSGDIYCRLRSESFIAGGARDKGESRNGTGARN
jgi:hypothetical protein